MQTVTNIKRLLMPVFEKYEGHIKFAYIFGSIAKSQVFPSSDIDIAVFLCKVEKKLYYEMKFSLYADICRVLKMNNVDVVMLNTTTNIMLLDEIVRHGIVLFDRDRHLREEYESKILHDAFDFKGQRMAVMGI